MIDDNDFEKESLIMFITESGFKFIPIQTVVDALSEMEQYMMQQTGVETHEELENYLNKIKEILGEKESMELDLEEIISWIKAVRGH